MAFRVGQKVVCVDASPNSWGDPTALVEGNIYTVAQLIQLGPVLGINVREAEVPQHLRAFYPAYHATRFRPVIEKSTDTGMAILRKVADDASKRRVLTVCGNE